MDTALALVFAKILEDSTSFQAARQTMADGLRNDSGTAIGYLSNVAMLLHDRYGITDFTTRNQAAADILKLLFDVELPVKDLLHGQDPKDRQKGS